MTKRYLCFERTRGARCWTLAFKTDVNGTVPAQFMTREKAEWYSRNEISTRRGWWGGEPDARPMDGCVVELSLPK